MTLAAAVLLAALATADADAVARVDGVAISRADVLERLRVLGERGQRATPSDTLTALVDEALLAAEARRQGLDREPLLSEQLASERRRLVLGALQEDLGAKANPSEELLRGLYHSTGDAARLTLVKVASREEAAAALDRVRAGGDLGDEARRSVDPALASGRGDTGLVSRGQLDPALADAAFRAAPGALFGPVELKLGWAFGRVVERTVADDAAFPSRRAALESFARQQLAAESLRHLKEQLAARTPVKLDEAFLRGLGNRAEATPQELQHVIAIVGKEPLRYAAIQPAIAYMASAGGHAAGPGAKVSLAKKAIEDRLLEAAAAERGLAAAPAVTRLLPGIERYLLANALATKLSAAPGRGKAEEKVRAKLAELRGRARIELDPTRLTSSSTR